MIPLLTFCLSASPLAPFFTNNQQLEDVKEINRFQEPPQTGALWYCFLTSPPLWRRVFSLTQTFNRGYSDMLWSDPDENYSSDDIHTTFEYNETRGCSYSFGYIFQALIFMLLMACMRKATGQWLNSWNGTSSCLLFGLMRRRMLGTVLCLRRCKLTIASFQIQNACKEQGDTIPHCDYHLLCSQLPGCIWQQGSCAPL